MTEPENKPRKMLNKTLYVIFSEVVEGSGDRDQVKAEHYAYQFSLEDRGVLFAAGPLLGENGKPTGTGMIVVRAASMEEAKAIADGDPFHKNGFRKYRIQPWRISEGTFSLRVKYSEGTFELD
ncbi:MAG: hypothetical protein RLZ98_687 [Pseudomonadota bacterium]|jgi:uncharacterized protein YciI